MTNLNCSTLEDCQSSAASALSDARSKWHAATAAAVFFGLFTSLVLLHLTAKLVVWYKEQGDISTARYINEMERGYLSLEPQSPGRSDEHVRLDVHRQLPGAESYFHQMARQDSPPYGGNNAHHDQERTPKVVGFDLVSVTHYGITLHSPKSPLRPRQPPAPQHARESGFPELRGPAAHRAERCSDTRIPQLVTASSEIARPTADELDTDFVQQTRWPFFRDTCVLEAGLLDSLFSN